MCLQVVFPWSLPQWHIEEVRRKKNATTWWRDSMKLGGNKNPADYGKCNWDFLLILPFEIYAGRCQENSWIRLFADQTEVVVTMSPENAWQLPSFYNWDGREAVSKLIVFFGVATKHALMRRCQHVYRHRIQLHKNDTPRKPTWQWKITILNRRYIFKWLVFQCNVSFLGCRFAKSFMFDLGFGEVMGPWSDLKLNTAHLFEKENWIHKYSRRSLVCKVCGA